ncbi:MAG: hypothetical protein K2X34_09020 [Hyphomonadaceae bacterium]|nr:hypothetical protein [Hyphomonadaceae bacterium]
MNNPTCSADRVEADARGAGPAIVFCVFHLIAGIVVAFAAIGVLALFA